MTIETMLKRFNNLERIYLSFLSEVNNDNIMDIKSNRYNEILNYIYKFNDEIKNAKQIMNNKKVLNFYKSKI